MLLTEIRLKMSNIRVMEPKQALRRIDLGNGHEEFHVIHRGLLVVIGARQSDSFPLPLRERVASCERT
jgi:hypothetical protein